MIEHGAETEKEWTWPTWPPIMAKLPAEVAVSTRRSLARGSQRPCQNGSPYWQKWRFPRMWVPHNHPLNGMFHMNLPF